MSARFRVGTSGWHYKHWRGRFYPLDLPPSRWLSYYSARFPSVEINNTFYRLPQPSTFVSWRQEAPPGFVFAIKASRGITHYRKLAGAEQPLETFLARARLLGSALGPVLYQLPPSLHRDDERLGRFLALLPTDLQYAIEFRHPSWFVEPIYALLRQHGVALCLVSMPDFTSPLVATAQFIYVLFHGTSGLYQGSYSDEELRRWAAELKLLCSSERHAFVYFNNDQNAYAVYNALTLAAFLA